MVELFVIIVNYYHNEPHLGGCSSPRSTSGMDVSESLRQKCYQDPPETFKKESSARTVNRF